MRCSWWPPGCCGGYVGGVAGGAGHGVHLRGAVVSMRAAGLRLMVRPWWWAVGIPEAWQVVRGMVSTSGAWW